MVGLLDVDAVKPEIHLLDQFIISEIQVRLEKLFEFLIAEEIQCDQWIILESKFRIEKLFDLLNKEFIILDIQIIRDNLVKFWDVETVKPEIRILD